MSLCGAQNKAWNDVLPEIPAIDKLGPSKGDGPCGRFTEDQIVAVLQDEGAVPHGRPSLAA
jgi:hypothetical protein